MKSFLLMLTFFTRLPMPFKFDFDSADFEKGIKYTPVVGAVIGGILWLASAALSGLDRAVYSVAMLFAYLWISGGLHMDGLADSADGLLSARDRNRMLEIMKDSNIGTFGVIAIFMLLSFNLALIYNLDGACLAAMPVVGRSCAILACFMGSYAREDGMGKSFVEKSGPVELSVAVAVSIAATALTGGPAYLTALAAAMVFTAFLTRRVSLAIGGITGDTVGLVIESSQTVFLLAAYMVGVYM